MSLEWTKSEWTKRYIKEVWNPSKARTWIRRELDRRSNVRSGKRQRELERRRDKAWRVNRLFCNCPECFRKAARS